MINSWAKYDIYNLIILIILIYYFCLTNCLFIYYIFPCIIQRKKSTKSDMEEEWDSNREKALEYIYRLLQLPLSKLWQPPIVEDSFIMYVYS